MFPTNNYLPPSLEAFPATQSIIITPTQQRSGTPSSKSHIHNNGSEDDDTDNLAKAPIVSLVFISHMFRCSSLHPS